MLELKATKEEVADISQRDNDAQGITDDDELFAEQSQNFGGLIIQYL